MKTSHTIYTSFAKRTAIILTLLLTLGVTSVWGETAIFTWKTKPSAYTSGSSNFSEGQVTFTGTSGTGSTPTRAWSDGLRMYAGSTAQFSVPDGYVITKIEGYTTFNFNNATGQQTVLFTGLSKATCSADVTVTYQSSGYTITYNTNGGTAVSSTTGTKLPNPLPTTTKTGYTFAGWYTNPNLATAAVAGTAINANTTLYAKWTPTEYTITYNGLEGATHSNPTNYTIESETITFTAPSERVGYNFIRWNPASITKGSTGNKTITAQWTEKPLTNYRTSCTTETIVTLDPNGGTISNTDGWTENGNGTYSKTHEGTEIALPTATKTNYNFGGWYNGETKYESIPSDLDESITLTAKWLEKQDAGIYWDSESVTVTIDADGNTLPVFNNPNEIEGITFSSSNSSVVAVDANGVITLGSTGTTATVTITATFDGNETYAAKTVTCSITVHPSNCKWVETDISDIESGDKVVITMTKGDTYAMSNNRATQYSPEAIIINVKDGVINEAVATHNQWTINKENSYLTFYADATNRLYGNSADDGLRVGSTNNAKTNHEFFIAGNYLVNNVTSRYVGVNLTKKEWYCYQTNTGNIKDQTLKFYKKECLPIGQYWINYELTDVVCTDNPVKNKISTDDDAVELNFEATGEHNELPTTIIVTNGSTTLTVNTDYTWNNATGVLTLNPSQITDNITISIAAQKRKYTVTFDANGHGTAPAAQSVTAEGTASEPTAPEATGYTFGGWYKEPECTTAFNFATPITGDITLYAKWTLNKYTITFKNYDGTELQRSEVAYGETPSYTGETPTREQTAQYTYTFKDWSPTIAPATQDQVYTAQFDEVTRSYTVTWMVGTTEYTAGTPTNQVEYDKKVTNLPTPPQDDAIGTCANKFIGWSTKTSGSNAENADYYDDLFTTAENSPAITDATTFYAVFATEEAGGGEQTAQVFATSSLGTTNTVTTGYTISAQAEKKTGYYQDGSGTKRYVQVMKSNVSTPMFANTPTSVTITAKLGGGSTNNDLTNSVYAIWLDKDGNELGNAVLITDKITATTGSNFTVNLPIANATSAYGVRVYHQKETGYNVRYYAISLSYKYNNTTYSNYVTNCCALAPATNLTVSGTTANSASLTWTAPSSTTGITKLQVRNAETDEVVVNNIAVNTTTATIIELKECTSYQYYVVSVGEDCEVVSNIVTAQPFGNAKTVNYNYNGGSGSVASFTTSCDDDKREIILPAATRPGYTFEGWYDPEGNKVGDAGATYDTATSPITLHAQWTIQSYTVTWNPNGGNWDGNTSNIVQTYEYGATIDKPEDPTRENAIFKGWSPAFITGTTMPASDKTYTAQWEMVYTLTFVDMNAGGTTSTLTQTSSGQDIVAPTANSEVCDMWTFIGWAPSNSLNGGTDKPTGFIAAGETIPGSQITGNKTYYSVYSYNSDNTQEFEVGKSGTYFMYAISGTTKYYATTVKTSNTAFYANTESDMSTYSSKKSTFILTYNTNTTKYVIKHINTTADKESEGYFYQADPTKKDITVNSSSPSSFEIAKGEIQGSYRIKFTYTANSNTVTGNFGQSSSSFQGYAEGYDIFFEPASEIQYYNAADCGEVETYTMSFHNPFGDENALVWNDAEHEEAYYTDQPLNTSIDVFPTMVYNGWTFMGWTANQQYNDLIGEENLDDENSATDDPASSCTLYSNTTGWAYTLNSNVTMYPVFTKFEDNEPFDMINGGDYYIYYIADADVTTSVDEYGVANRIYAGGWEAGGTSDSYGATQSCSNATLFTFTKQSNDKWTIYDNTNRKYLCAGTTDNNLALNATPATNGEWTITVHDGNQVNAVSKDGYTLSALSQDAVSGTFKNYATSNFNNNSGYYHRVYLGSCTERVYSSNPSNKPVITLSGTPQVTSTVEQSIRAQGELSISATKLAANATITLTSDNADVYFATDKTANFSKATKPITPLTLKADEKGKLAMTTVYVHYKPTSTSTLGVQTANITATTGTDGQPDYATATTIAALRNLPAKFVIATKVGATWYALPANMNGATNPEGVIIEVDETTMNATAPNTTVYTLFPVKTTTGSEDRYAQYGDRVRFSAVNNGYNGLWTSSSESTIRNYAVINDVRDGSSDASYEWKITTTIVDGNWQYTLQTDQSNNQKYLRYWTAASGGAKWGTYASGNDKLYFLPVTETKPFDYKVVEWYPTKVLIQTEAAITNPIVKIGGILVDKVTCTNKGGKLYEISGLPLVNNPTKVLTLSYTADEVTYTNSKVVPIILSRETKSISGEPFVALTKEVYNYADLVVRDGATLTMDGTQEANTLWDVTIYPTSKISVPESKKLTVHSLTFFGGIDEIYNGSTYTLNKYGVPELSLKGSLKKSISTIDYLMRVNLDQMYSLSVPYDVQLADIKYWDGSDIALGDALYVSAYDGAARANQSKKTWIYETDFESKLGAATLKAGVGYTISAELQAGVGSEYSILRMPMNSNIANDATEVAKTVAVTAWGIDANITDNHKGWNLVGNPYMTAISGGEADTKLVLGYLKETGTGPWEWVEKTYRYVTIPADNGKDYSQQKFTDAVLPPFKNFFVQIGTSGDLVFGLSTRKNMRAHHSESSVERDVEFEILMSNDARQDNTGLLISEEYSPAYEINADLEKMIGSMSVYTIYGGYKLAYNALSPINASEWIPMGYIAPAAGEYTFRLDDIDKIVEQVEHVYLIDYEANNIVDLMDDEYEFTTDKEQNNNRFAINIVLIQDKDNTTTGMDIINGNVAAPIKFIYHDKLYIQSGGVIYDGTGKQVTNINK